MNLYQQLAGGGGGPGGGADVLLTDPLERYNASDFHPPPYVPSRSIEDQHHFWRAGHTNEFSALVEGFTQDSGTAEDYIVGVLAGAMLIFGIALVCFMVIVGLKIAGRKRVGFLAGRLVHPDCDCGGGNSAGDSGTLPAIPEEPEAEAGEGGGSLLDAETSAPLIISDSIVEDAEKGKREKKFSRKVLFVRLAFVFSALAVMVCGILLYSKGVASFKRSLDNVDHGLSMVQSTAGEAINVARGLNKEKDVLQGDMERTTRSVKGEICDGSGPLAQEIESRWQEAKKDIKELDETVNENVELFVNDLNEVITLAEDARGHLHYADIFFGIAVAVSVIINVLILSMLAVAYFSARGVENCCTKLLTYAVLWPVFVFFLVFFWIFSLLFLVSSLAGSDFCVQPDAYVEGFLRKNQDLFGSAIFQFAIYWVSGCTIKPHNGQFKELMDQIEEGITVTHDFAEAIINQPIQQLEGQCGLSNAGAAALNGGAALLHNATHSVNRLWIQTRTILECRTFNPIYTKFAHDALCIDGVGGLTWLFTTSMFLFVFAMIMIMFRAALYPVKRPPTREGGGLSASLLSKSGS